MSERSFEELYDELEESQQEVHRLRAENQRLLDGSQESRIEESQALTLAAETARQAAEDKNLELSRLVTESNQRMEALHTQLEELQRELAQARAELTASQSKESEEDASRAAVQKLQQQLHQLHATSKSKLQKMAEDSRERHRLWEESQQRVDHLQEELKNARSKEDLGQDLQQANARVAELEAQNQKQERLIGQLRGEAEDYQLALDTNEDQIRFLESELEDREQIVDSLREQLASYLEKLRLAQGKLYRVGEAVEQRNAWLRQLQEQNRSLSAKCRSWEVHHQLSLSAKSELEVVHKRTLQELDEVRWELEETQANLEDSQNMVSNMQDQLAEQMPRARREIEQIQAKYRDAVRHLSDLQGRFQELTGDSQEGEPTVSDMPAVVSSPSLQSP